MAADRLETASELLQRRDELMLCGWDGVSSDGCPRIARDLALAEKDYVDSFPSEAERIAAVAEAFDAGQSGSRNLITYRLSGDFDVYFLRLADFSRRSRTGPNSMRESVTPRS